MADNMWTTIINEWRAFCVRQRILWRAKRQNRGATLIQVVGMMLNNFAFIAVWLLFFRATGSVNGWGQLQTLGLLGYGFLVFGLAVTWSSGADLLPQWITSGRVDRYLLQPKGLWMNIVTSAVHESAIGDAVLGVLLIGFYLSRVSDPWWGFLGIILSLPAGVAIILGYLVTIGLLGFFLRWAEANMLVANLRRVLLTPSLYPSSLFPTILKYFFIFVIPALCLGGLPIEMVQNHTWYWLLVMYVLATLWITVSVFGLRWAIRRYESGNTMGQLE